MKYSLPYSAVCILNDRYFNRLAFDQKQTKLKAKEIVNEEMGISRHYNQPLTTIINVDDDDDDDDGDWQLVQIYRTQFYVN